MSAEVQADFSDDVKQLQFLVAENNPTLRKSIIKTLNEAGISKISAFSNGAEAWNQWESHKGFGVIICSWNLPELNGIDILKRVRGDSAAKLQPAVIMLSSDASSDAEGKATSEGADAFLGKPFAAEDLIPRVKEGIDKRKREGGGSSLAQHALEASLLGTTHEVELVFERYSTMVDCEELKRDRCVIRVNNNYGLGTRLTMRFSRRKPGADGDKFYKPVKGTVMKTVRVPKDFGEFLLHLHFNGRVAESSGIPELLRETMGNTAL